jgi:hypothetical protein
MTVSRISDQVALVLEEKSTTDATPGIKIGSMIMDADAYPTDQRPCLLAFTKKTGGGSGYIRIYDSTNDEELALVEVTSSNYVIIKEMLANYIVSGVVSGQAKIEMWIYTDGTGIMFVECANIGMCWIS